LGHICLSACAAFSSPASSSCSSHFWVSRRLGVITLAVALSRRLVVACSSASAVVRDMVGDVSGELFLRLRPRSLSCLSVA
jgi:hypothetical protein